MIVKQSIIKIVTISLLLSSAIASDIKGKVNAINSLSTTPYSLKGVTIDLYQNRSKEWFKIASFISDGEGMYYFKDIQEGNYSIQVNGQTNYPIEIGDKAQQELPPIIIRYE